MAPGPTEMATTNLSTFSTRWPSRGPRTCSPSCWVVEGSSLAYRSVTVMRRSVPEPVRVWCVPEGPVDVQGEGSGGQTAEVQDGVGSPSEAVAAQHPARLG